MPFKHEILKLKIRPEDDKRRKLSASDREYIKDLYESGLVSIHGLARQFKVSKRLIQFILFPERQHKVDNKKYYDRDKNAEYKRRNRKHRNELFEKGRLIDDNLRVDESFED